MDPLTVPGTTESSRMEDTSRASEGNSNIADAIQTGSVHHPGSCATNSSAPPESMELDRTNDRYFGSLRFPSGSGHCQSHPTPFEEVAICLQLQARNWKVETETGHLFGRRPQMHEIAIAAPRIFLREAPPRRFRSRFPYNCSDALSYGGCEKT